VLIIAAFHNLTGFATGIFTPEQLSGNLPERQDKLQFFSVLREYVQRVSDQTVDVSTKAIIAGHEVAKTLIFLKQIVYAVEHPVRRFESIRRKQDSGQRKEQTEPNDTALRSEIERLTTFVREQERQMERLRQQPAEGGCPENTFLFTVRLPRPIRGAGEARRRVVKFEPTKKDGSDA
jgi:hypothetical protein